MKYFKTIVKFEVLSSEEPWCGEDLKSLDYDTSEGHCSGMFLDFESIELSQADMHLALKAQGTDPTFLDPMDDEEYLSDASSKELNALKDVLGYLPDPEAIDRAISKCPMGSTQELKALLKKKERDLTKKGGRGVELAEDIDALKITITVRELKESEILREFRDSGRYIE